MAYDGRYDDPKFINAFLADMNETEEELNGSADQGKDPATAQVNGHAAEQNSQPKSQAGTDSPALTYTGSSPPLGTLAPPPTPETAAAVVSTVKYLPSIDEDSDAAASCDGAVVEQTEASSPFNASVRSFRPSSVNGDLATAVKARQLATENDLASSVFDDEEVRNYHQNALDKFRAEAHARIASRNSVDLAAQANDEQLVSKTKNLTVADKVEDVPKLGADQGHTDPVDHEHSFNVSSSFSTGVFQEAQDETTAISSNESDDDSSVNIIVDAPKSPDSFKSVKSIIPITSPYSVNTGKDASAKVVKEDSAAVKPDHENESPVKVESREDAIYFPSWGNPAARSGGPARVRKVIIYQLPATADFTLVQSLIHGGAIEVMTMTPPHNGTVNAFVTFTNADACDSYYKKYPNGLEFKHVGKKCTVFIHIGTDVNVVSGILQSYLECGASRVVKVAGADHDWSMRALHRVAGGKDNRRKVEVILDSYRNDSRTIIFRFTKIADGVSFRGELLRDPEWQDTDIQFAVDPCEKATGVHLE